MPSFDVISEVDQQELRNAVDQVRREIETRYDFKGSKASIEREEFMITLLADDQMKLEALREMLRQRLAKRGVALAAVEFQSEEKAGGDMIRQNVQIKNGLSAEETKRLGKIIRDKKLKVTAQTQGEQLRVSGKKRDDLQVAISSLREEVQDIPLQFVNFRD